MEPIDEALKRIAGGTSKASSPTSSSTDLDNLGSVRDVNKPGDPNCPYCAGIGFVRRNAPVGHPDFGRVDICPCRQEEVLRATYQRLYRLSNLDAFRGMDFDNFNTEGLVGMSDDQIRSLNTARNATQYYSQHLDGWLLLLGSFGVGKTHLAAAIANFAISLGVPTLF